MVEIGTSDIDRSNAAPGPLHGPRLQLPHLPIEVISEAELSAWAPIQLDQRQPDLSAKSRDSHAAPHPVSQILWALCIAGLFQPAALCAALLLLSFGLFATAIAIRLHLLFSTWRHRADMHTFRASPVQYGWPTYTVLVPLFREAASVPGLADALRRLDWPAISLEVILLLESGDTETRAALAFEAWPQRTRVFILPPGRPQTKPRALNYGLARACGRYVCVFDAEDRPNPLQLRAAVSALEQAEPTCIGVQAPLIGVSNTSSWIAAQWCLEYAIHFRCIIPALARSGWPMLLGGTSNHFRTTMLRELHAWDAWNVTEDADLGVRLRRKGWHMRTIKAPTLEAPPESVAVWVAQRSRWLKGFWVSWLVYMRQPRQTIRELGWIDSFLINLLLLGPVLSAAWAFPASVFVTGALMSGLNLPVAAIALCSAGAVAHLLAVLLVPDGSWRQRLCLLVSAPFYFALQTPACARALYGWLKQPHFWAKTPHPLWDEMEMGADRSLN